MFIIVLTVLVLLPIAEIYILIESGRLIGVIPTVLLVILTGIAGTWLMKQQGLELLRRVQSELAAGRLPAGVLLDGALVLVGGVLLLTPGFCTDLMGFTLLVPFTRAIWRKALELWLAKKVASGRLIVRRF